MSYGATVRNNAGQLVFSSEYPSLRFVGKFASSLYASNAIVTSGGSTIGTCYLRYANITCVGHPIVFIECPDSASLISIVNTGGDTWQIRSASRIPSVTYYVFSRSPAAQTSGYGMNLYDSAGACVFSTAHRVLKVAATFTGSVAAVYAFTYGSLPAAPAFYIGTRLAGFQQDSVAVPGQLWTGWFGLKLPFSTTGHVIRGRRRSSGVGPGFISVYPPIARGLIIDTSLYQ